MEESLREDAIDFVSRMEAVVGRYDAEQLLLAAAVGALVQIIALLAFKVIGAMLGLIARVAAWSVGAAVALYLLDQGTSAAADGNDVARVLDRVLASIR